MKKLCFIINSSGSLSVAYPLIDSICKKKNINLILLFSNQLLNNKILKNIKIKKIYLKNRISVDKSISYLKKIKPDLIFCGNNGNNTFELNFSRAAKSLRIKFLTIMDSWSYPLRRFQFKKNNKNYLIIPDIMGLPNKQILNQIKKVKKINSEMFIAGFPQINFNVYKYFLNKKKNKKINTYEFLYVSSPYEKSKKYSIQDGSEIFYDQKKIIKKFLDFTSYFAIQNKLKINITFRIHPLETIHFNIFLKKLKKKRSKNISFFIDKKIHNYDSYSNKDGVFGISSMMLHEASLCKLPSISLQLDGEFNNSGKKNYFGKIKQIKVCKNKSDLCEILKKICIQKNNIFKNKDKLKKIHLSKNKLIVKKIIKELNSI